MSVVAKGLYHPSKIFEAKRAQKLLAATPKSENPEDKENPAQAKEKELVRPEGLGGIYFDAVSYLSKAVSHAKLLMAKIESLRSITQEALDVKLTDNDRKGIFKRFVAARIDLDRFAKNVEVDGDQLFSGKFANKPRVIKGGATDEEGIKIRIDPLHAEALKIDRLRVDSFPTAKKSSEYLEKAKKEVHAALEFLTNRLSNVDYKLSNFIKAASEKEKALKGSGASVESYSYTNIRMQQERAAQVKGRTSALLVNRKI